MLYMPITVLQSFRDRVSKNHVCFTTLLLHMIFAIIHILKAFILAQIRLLALSGILFYIFVSGFRISCTGLVARRMTLMAM